jgi:hypothetical protein
MKLRGLVPNSTIMYLSVSNLNISRIGLPILLQIQNTLIQIHECRNWERGPAVSFPGIFVSNFRCSVFAVHVDCRFLCDVRKDISLLFSRYLYLFVF